MQHSFFQTYLLDNRKNPRHSVVVTVRANAQIDLLGILVGTVRSHQTKQRVLRCLLHGAKGAHGSIGRHVELVVELAKTLCRIVLSRIGVVWVG